MSWSEIAALCSCLGVFATILGVAYTSGRLTEKLRSNETKTAEHGIVLLKHGVKLTEHDIALGRLESYRLGFRAGRHDDGERE